MPRTKSTRGGKAPEPSPPEKKVNLGCSRTPPLPKSLVLKDVRNRVWSLGKSVGSGGFGDIYLCDRKSSGSVSDNAEFVVKVEPHDNGPLFVEMHFFMRVALSSQMAEWDPREGRPLGFVGMPTYQGSGSVLFKGNKYRFLVMDRFGSDLDKFFQGGVQPFPLPTVLNIAVQVIDTLQYIHSKNYTHNDIKAQNLLLGYGRGKQDLVYLVDYGLACKFRDDYGFHHSSAPDARKAHDGTMEYTSRDAHTGAHSRRGDLETLGYNMVHWLSGYLPWMNYLEEPEQVAAQKNGYMGSIKSFLTRCFRTESYPDIMEDYLNYVAQLEFETEPDYDYLRSMLAMALKEAGSQLDSKLQLSVPKSKKGKKGKSQKGNSKEPEEAKRGSTPDIPEFGVEELRSNTRSRGNDNSKSWNWEEVLCGNPEDILKASSNPDEDEDQNNEKEAANLERQAKALLNPTPEMKKMLDARKEAEAAREGMTWKEQLTQFNQKNALAKARWAEADLTPKYHTPVMEEVMRRRSDRLSIDAAPETPEPSDHNDSDPEVELNVSPKTKNKKLVKGKKTTATRNKKSSLSTNTKAQPVSPPTSKPVRSTSRRKVNTDGKNIKTQPISSAKPKKPEPIPSPEPNKSQPKSHDEPKISPPILVPEPSPKAQPISSPESITNIKSQKPKSDLSKPNSPSETVLLKKTRAMAESKSTPEIKGITSQRRKSTAPSKSQPSSSVETATKSKKEKPVTPSERITIYNYKKFAPKLKSPEPPPVSNLQPKPATPPLIDSDPIKNKVITPTIPTPTVPITKIVYAKSSRNASPLVLPTNTTKISASPLIHSTDTTKISAPPNHSTNTTKISASPLIHPTDTTMNISLPGSSPNPIRNLLQNTHPTVTPPHTTTTVPSQLVNIVYAKSSRNLQQHGQPKDSRRTENDSLPTPSINIPQPSCTSNLLRDILQPQTASILNPVRNIAQPQPASIHNPVRNVAQPQSSCTSNLLRDFLQPQPASIPNPVRNIAQPQAASIPDPVRNVAQPQAASIPIPVGNVAQSQPVNIPNPVRDILHPQPASVPNPVRDLLHSQQPASISNPARNILQPNPASTPNLLRDIVRPQPNPVKNILHSPNASIPNPAWSTFQPTYPTTPTSSRTVHQPSCSPDVQRSNQIPRPTFDNILHPTYPSNPAHSRNILSSSNPETAYSAEPVRSRIISQSTRPSDLINNQTTHTVVQPVNKHAPQSANPPIHTDPANGRNLPELTSEFLRSILQPSLPPNPTNNTNVPSTVYSSNISSGRNILQHTNPMHPTTKAFPTQPNKIVFASSSRIISQPAAPANSTPEANPSRSANIVYAVSSRSVPQPTYLAERTESVPHFRSTTQIPQPLSSTSSSMQNTPVPPSFLSSSVPASVTSLTELDISISSANMVNGLFSPSPGGEENGASSSPPSSKKMTTCSICAKVMYRASMARHYRDVHKLSDEQRREIRENRTHLETDNTKSESVEKVEHHKGNQNISDSAEERLSWMEQRKLEDSLAQIVRDHNLDLDEPLDRDSMMVTVDPAEVDSFLAALEPPIEVSSSPTLPVHSEIPDRLSPSDNKDFAEDSSVSSVIFLSDESRSSPAVMSSTESNPSPVVVIEDSSSSSLAESSEDANSMPMIVDPLTGELYMDGSTECPICGASMLKSVVAKHCADVHNSPVHKTRKRKSNNVPAVVKISISQDSPARIRNKDSPNKTMQDISPPSKPQGKRSLMKTVTIAEQVSVEGETKTIGLKGSVDEEWLSLSPSLDDDNLSIVEVLPPKKDEICLMPEIKLVSIPSSETSPSVSSGSPCPGQSFKSATPSPVESDLSPSPSLSESTNQTLLAPESRTPSPASSEKESPITQLRNKMQDLKRQIEEFSNPPSSDSSFHSLPLVSKNRNNALLPASPMFSPSPSPDLERPSRNSSIIPQESWKALDTGTPTPPLKLTKLHSGTSTNRNEVWQVTPRKIPAAQPTIEVGQVTPQKLPAPQMTCPKLPATQMTPEKLPAPQMTPPKLPATQVTPPKLPAPQMTPLKLPATQVTPQKLPTIPPTIHDVPKNGVVVNDSCSNSVIEESYPDGIIEESSNDSEMSAISAESNKSSKSTSSNEVIINAKCPLSPPPKPIVFAPRRVTPPPPPIKTPEPPRPHNQIEREAHLDALFDQILSSPTKTPNPRPMTNVQELPKDGGLIFQDDVSDTDSYQSDSDEQTQYESDEDDDIIMNVDESWLNIQKQTGELDEGDEDSAVDISFEGHDDYQDETDGGSGSKKEFSVNCQNNKDNTGVDLTIPEIQDVVKKKSITKKSKESAVSPNISSKQKKIQKAPTEKSKKPVKKVTTKIQKPLKKKETSSKKISKPKVGSPEVRKNNPIKKATSQTTTKKLSKTNSKKETDETKVFVNTPNTPNTAKRKRKPSKKVLENEDSSPPNKLVKLSAPIHSELLPLEITVPGGKQRKQSPKSPSPPSKKQKPSKTLNGGKKKISSELADIDDKRTSKPNAKISKVTSSLLKNPQGVTKTTKQGKKGEKAVKLLTKSSSEKVMPKKGDTKNKKKRTRGAAVSTRSLDLTYHF